MAVSDKSKDGEIDYRRFVQTISMTSQCHVQTTDAVKAESQQSTTKLRKASAKQGSCAACGISDDGCERSIANADPHRGSNGATRSTLESGRWGNHVKVLFQKILIGNIRFGRRQIKISRKKFG